MKRMALLVLLLILASGLPAATRKAPSKVLKLKASPSKRSSRLFQHVTYSHGKVAHWSAAPAMLNQLPRQTAPSPDRYKEIQQALAAKGYFPTEPTGIWDDASQDALRRFQAEHNLDATGKLSARSLILLGLGPAESNEAASPVQQ